MWNSLKSHILRERQRKKLEQEADAEVERQRREREDQQKEQEMTLEETREQVAQSESRLAQLKEDKHQLFLQLKKVLNEDESRKKIKESNNNGEITFLHGYPAPGSSNPSLAHVGSASGFLQTVGHNKPSFVTNKEESGNTTKHSRSPSPPHQSYVPYKTQAMSYSSGNMSQPYGSSSVGAAVYYNQLGSSSSNIAGQGGFQFPSNTVYTYPAQYAAGSRSHFAIQSSTLSKDELMKHQSNLVALGSSQVIPQRAMLGGRNTTGASNQGFLHSNQEHGSLVKPSAPNMYPSVEQERFYLPQNVSGSLAQTRLLPPSGNQPLLHPRYYGNPN